MQTKQSQRHCSFLRPSEMLLIYLAVGVAVVAGAGAWFGEMEVNLRAGKSVDS